jgi:hypothetical protein
MAYKDADIVNKLKALLKEPGYKSSFSDGIVTYNDSVFKIPKNPTVKRKTTLSLR